MQEEILSVIYSKISKNFRLLEKSSSILIKKNIDIIQIRNLLIHFNIMKVDNELDRWKLMLRNRDTEKLEMETMDCIVKNKEMDIFRGVALYYHIKSLLSRNQVEYAIDILKKYIGKCELNKEYNLDIKNEIEKLNPDKKRRISRIEKSIHAIETDMRNYVLASDKKEEKLNQEKMREYEVEYFDDTYKFFLKEIKIRMKNLQKNKNTKEISESFKIIKEKRSIANIIRKDEAHVRLIWYSEDELLDAEYDCKEITKNINKLVSTFPYDK